MSPSAETLPDAAVVLSCCVPGTEAMPGGQGVPAGPFPWPGCIGLAALLCSSLQSFLAAAVAMETGARPVAEAQGCGDGERPAESGIFQPPKVNTGGFKVISPNLAVIYVSMLCLCFPLGVFLQGLVVQLLSHV